MPESQERAEARYENLQAIEPLLGSLRVLSLSTMQMALNRKQDLTRYAESFLQVAGQLRGAAGKQKPSTGQVQTPAYPPRKPRKILAIIGSSRGIIGMYNKHLARRAAELSTDPSEERLILAFGRRLQTALTQQGVSFTPKDSLSSGSTPDYAAASGLIRAWTRDFEAGLLSAVEILSYRKKRRSGEYQPTLTQIIPEHNTRFESLDKNIGQTTAERQNSRHILWPEAIIEGDPAVLLEKISGHLTAIRFYQLILDSVAAENLFRYRLLEEAKENTDQLLEELGQAIQAERRKQITQQLQELLTGSDMLGRR